MKISLLISLLLSSIGLAQASNLAKGKELVEKNNCAACHGANLNEPVIPAYPKLAGQYPDYLYYALRSYQVANNPNFGRKNAVMTSQVTQYSDADLRDMAAYIASLPGNMVIRK
jgi:cytochrome c553